MTSTSALRREWAPPCPPASQRTTLDLHGGGRINILTAAADAFRALNACLVAHDYRTRRADTGAFNCRRITNGVGYSLHAYGVAADLNWQSNSYGPRLVTDMPASLVASIKGLRTRTGAQVFRWGGDYSGNKDAMHFEVVCTRRDMASGINPATVPGRNPDVPRARSVIRLGDSGKDVEFLQHMLNIILLWTAVPHGPTGGRALGDGQGLATDGNYGPRTAGRVKEYEAWYRARQERQDPKPPLLQVDGITTGPTLAAVAFDVPNALRDLK